MENYGLVASPGEANRSGVGIGVGLRADAAGVHVNRVFHGGPAHLCGRVAVGDVLEEVGGLPVRGVNEAESALAGPLGSIVDVAMQMAEGSAGEGSAAGARLGSSSSGSRCTQQVFRSR